MVIVLMRRGIEGIPLGYLVLQRRSLDYDNSVQTLKEQSMKPGLRKTPCRLLNFAFRLV